MEPAVDSGFKCALTGDALFASGHAHELIEEGLVYSVRGSLDEGLCALALNKIDLTSDGELPCEAIDVVRWAGLRRVHLDKPGFVKHWQRYVNAIRNLLDPGQQEGYKRADELLLRAHEFARKLMVHFDELDFFVTASERVPGPLIILHYKDSEPLVPHFYFLSDGILQ